MGFIQYIGIDVSKEWIDVAVHEKAAKPERFSNSSEGFAAFSSRFCDTIKDSLVVLETTGGYESALVAALVEMGAKIHLACPARAKAFARSVRLHGKTDSLDARMLAQYGAQRHETLSIFKPLEEDERRIKAFSSRREDLVRFLVCEKQRLDHPNYEYFQDQLKAAIAQYEEQIAHLESEISALIARNEMLVKKYEIMVAQSGVGAKSAAKLIAHFPELGTLTRRQAASMSGCAPHPKESGKKEGNRTIKGGRREVRKALYMCALSASKHNPQLMGFHKRLIEKGRKPIVALVAVMRKLVVILNAKIRDELYC